MFKTTLLTLALCASVSASYVKPADLKNGCARFYLSNPLKKYCPKADCLTKEEYIIDSETQYWQVCVDAVKDKPTKVSIGSGLFEKIKDKYGQDTTNSISFISTGSNCWVKIFSGKSQTGKAYEVPPLQDVDLAEISLDADGLLEGHESFNDNIMSGWIRGTDSKNENPDSNDTPEGVVPIAVWYTFKNVDVIPDTSGCGYFYDKDPRQKPASGFAICMSNNQHLAHVNQKDMYDRGYIEALTTGAVKFVTAGPDLEIGLYEEDNFQGEKTVIKSTIDRYVRHDVQSFIMLSTTYPKEITPSEMLMRAEKISRADTTFESNSKFNMLFTSPVDTTDHTEKLIAAFNALYIPSQVASKKAIHKSKA